MTGATTSRSHGQVRGADLSRQSQFFQGRFGRSFRTLPAAHFSENALIALGNAMIAEHEKTPTPETEVDDEENQGISAGYTYLGQFIDHDLTFDPVSSLQKQDDPDALVDYRTPRFDLDCVYGRGPEDQPYLYDDAGRRFRLGRLLTGNPNDKATRDLPRHRSETNEKTRARALIGDPRNDENVIVSQLQATMLRFHNTLADRHKDLAFPEIQQLVRWHYQWVVLHDFLPTIVGSDMVFSILPHLKSGKSIKEDKPKLRFYHAREEAFIPIEFSVAAYRFGHSMVRPIYRLNTTLGKNPAPKSDPVNGRQFIFDPTDDTRSLNGFREFPSNWAIEWRLFFDMGDRPPQLGVTRLQRAYKIDSSLVNPLGRLPKQIASDERSLAARNLLRGLRMGLPSGQDVARALEISPLPDAKLVVGKANQDGKKTNKSIVDLPRVGSEFEGNAPLWYYVLAEAQQQFKTNDTPIRLGPVGGQIVAETLIGLMLADSHSFLAQDPTWVPNRKQAFDMADLIATATRP
jgi:hypothetical protein